MKKLVLAVAVFLMMVGVAGAENSCESAKTHKVCGAKIEGKDLYTVTTDDCSKINHIGFFYHSFDSARDLANVKNASEYSSCETDRQLKKSNKEIDEVKWFEVQLDK